MAGHGRGPAEEVRRFVAELARRRVFQVVAIYGGVAFALLEGTALIVDELSLPPTIVTTLTVVVLIGFVIALGIGWIYDLDAAGRLHRTGPEEAEETLLPAAGTASEAGTEPTTASYAGAGLGWRLRIAGVGALVLVVLVSWLIATRVLPLEKAYAVSDPRGSYLVAPIHSRSQSEADLALAERAAGRLMFKLRGWQSVRVVQEFALTGMLYELDIRSRDAPSLEQAFRMARMQQVGTVLGLRVTADADTAHLEAVLYDVASQREVGDPYFVTAALDDIDDLVAPVARTILRLRDQEVGLEELRAESPDLDAHQDFSEGLTALYEWRLGQAEARFRGAIATDSLFAAAHHYLAMTLYWQTARDVERISQHGPEIARLTQAASRLAERRDLRPGLREHVEAFRAFWDGDYDRARERYRRLLDRDPSDTEAWILLGAVEFTDPYLERTENGTLRPRRNPNAARRAFERAIKLSPDLQLSYGHLFALDRELLSAVLPGAGCPAFEPPEATTLPPYLTPEAGHQLAFCPLMADSVTWLPRQAFDILDLRGPHQLAQREMRRSRTLLENWVRIHPDQPRPHEELDLWLTWRRSIESCTADPAEISELTRAIRVHREQALALRGDTTPEDRSRLALLLLADGDVEEAIGLVDAATAGGASGSSLAANLYLALGRTEDALSAAEPAYTNASWGRRDPADGTIILAGDVSGLVREIAMRGATGDDGPELRAAFRQLIAAWAPPDYTRRQSVLMRKMMLQFGVAPGLLLASDVRPLWFADWEAEGVPVDDVWRGLSFDDPPPPAAAKSLEAALRRQQAARRTIAVDHMAAGLLARAVGRDSVAAAQFRLVEACPLSLDVLDEGWGLRSLSRLYLARTLEALGDSAGAQRAMNRFSVVWRGESTPESR